ncbi:MAG TPA: LysR family transcriptional regulator [Myxococcales bacterium]|nr:LysR family transcriptional regulator [Myxococcales bacterium]
MNIPWDDVRLFLAIAETGSLSGAAKRLRVGQPTVSRRLAQLEHELGAALFRRRATGVTPTEAAERLLEPARKMAEQAGEIARAASRGAAAPAGLVRIATAPGVAFEFVAPFAAWLRERHPELRLEVLSSIEYLDLARGEAHLALRLRAPPPGDLTVVASLRHRNAVFVSKDYAARLPKRPKLSELRWIGWAPPYDQVPPNPQLAALIPGFEPVFTADNFLVQLRAAEAGLGAMILGDVPHRFAAPRPRPLVPLDVSLGPYAHADMHLVCAKSALDISRVRRVAELLAEELRRLSRA